LAAAIRFGLRRIIMHRTIDLDYQSVGSAEEVGDERTERLLTPEL
jgi:hypothetical protein